MGIVNFEPERRVTCHKEVQVSCSAKPERERLQAERATGEMGFGAGL